MRNDSEGGLRALIRGLREEAAHPARQGALYIVPTDYEALRRKGTHSMILERDEDGFFDRVVTFHPMNAAWNVHRVAPSNTVYEFGKSVLPGLGRWRLARAIQFPLHLLFIVSASVYLARKGIVGLIRATDPCWSGLLAWAAATLSGLPYCVSIHSDYDKCFLLDPLRSAPRMCAGTWRT